jgi:hypothetical protein
MRTQIIFALTLFSLIGIVAASGAASLYTENNPLRMNYGETKIIDLNLQNMAGEGGDITYKIEILTGDDIASLEKDTYDVKFGTYDTNAPVTITVPENYGKNSQLVTIEGKTVTSGEGGMVTFGTGWTVSFSVILSDEEEANPSSSSTIIYILVALIIIAFAVVLAVKKMKK